MVILKIVSANKNLWRYIEIIGCMKEKTIINPSILSSYHKYKLNQIDRSLSLSTV